MPGNSQLEEQILELTERFGIASRGYPPSVVASVACAAVLASAKMSSVNDGEKILTAVIDRLTNELMTGKSLSYIFTGVNPTPGVKH